MHENLKNIASVIENAMKWDAFSGAEISVIHKGDSLYHECFGMADKEKGIKMSGDSIFRLFSLTKPITAVAAMILLERGSIELRYPVKWFIPEFENPMVLDENGLHPAGRDITIGDLLTMTSGIPYPDGSPAGMKMGELWGRQSYAYENGGQCMTTCEFAAEMGKSPLVFSPGERWMYGASADIMGAVIEKVSGMRYGEFLEKEIFKPLGMNDTGFFIPEEKYRRLAQAYDRTAEGNVPFTQFSLCLTDYRVPPAFESGGAGLVSTMSDYSKFVKMLMGKGTYNGVRILGRKTVELMTCNFLDDRQMSSLDWDSMKGHGYGSFMRILENPAAAGLNQTKGSFGWDGWMGCYFSIDPAEELAMLFFIQQTNSGCTDITRKLQNIVWGIL